jgi:hypothetical protein
MLILSHSSRADESLRFYVLTYGYFVRRYSKRSDLIFGSFSSVSGYAKVVSPVKSSTILKTFSLFLAKPNPTNFKFGFTKFLKWKGDLEISS